MDAAEGRGNESLIGGGFYWKDGSLIAGALLAVMEREVGSALSRYKQAVQ